MAFSGRKGKKTVKKKTKKTCAKSPCKNVYSKREKMKEECRKLHLLKLPYLKIYTRYGDEILNAYLLLHSQLDTISLIPK